MRLIPPNPERHSDIRTWVATYAYSACILSSSVVFPAVSPATFAFTSGPGACGRLPVRVPRPHLLPALERRPRNRPAVCLAPHPLRSAVHTCLLLRLRFGLAPLPSLRLQLRGAPPPHVPFARYGLCRLLSVGLQTSPLRLLARATPPPQTASQQLLLGLSAPKTVRRFRLRRGHLRLPLQRIADLQVRTGSCFAFKSL